MLLPPVGAHWPGRNWSYGWEGARFVMALGRFSFVPDHATRLACRERRRAW